MRTSNRSSVFCQICKTNLVEYSLIDGDLVIDLCNACTGAPYEDFRGRAQWCGTSNKMEQCTPPWPENVPGFMYLALKFWLSGLITFNIGPITTVEEMNYDIPQGGPLDKTVQNP